MDLRSLIVMWIESFLILVFLNYLNIAKKTRTVFLLVSVFCICITVAKANIFWCNKNSSNLFPRAYITIFLKRKNFEPIYINYKSISFKKWNMYFSLERFHNNRKKNMSSLFGFKQRQIRMFETHWYFFLFQSMYYFSSDKEKLKIYLSQKKNITTLYE